MRCPRGCLRRPRHALLALAHAAAALPALLWSLVLRRDFGPEDSGTALPVTDAERCRGDSREKSEDELDEERDAYVRRAFERAEVARFNGAPEGARKGIGQSSWEAGSGAADQASVFEGLGLQSRWGTRSVRAALVMRVILPLLLRFSCPKTALSLREVGARVKNFDQEIPWSTVWESTRAAPGSSRWPLAG
ncbi:unnamed protein product, partial [Prorocentrum cordatum]